MGIQSTMSPARALTGVEVCSVGESPEFSSGCWDWADFESQRNLMLVSVTPYKSKDFYLNVEKYYCFCAAGD